MPLVLIIFASCKAKSPDIKIGPSTWASENLDLDHFNNGDEISEAKTADQWKEADKERKPAWCYYEFGLNGSGYGRFYNWYAVNDSRGLAPKGYHIPTKDEFLSLIKTIGGQEKGFKLKSINGWENFEGSTATGTNDFGFNALSSGIVVLELGKMEFFESQKTGYWWSSTRVDSGKAVCLRLDWFAVFANQEDLGVGMPVRVVKDL